MRLYLRSNILFVMLFVATINLLSGQNKTDVTIYCSKVLKEPLNLSGFFNTSLRNAPPPSMLERMEEEYGKAKIIRCWLFFDDMWDYRTEEYRFNFQIGKDYYVGDTIKFKGISPNPSAISLESDIFYEDYLHSVSQHCDEILLNVMRYVKEVQHGTISIEKWKEVIKTGLKYYKKRFPKIRYIEVLNESKVPHFGGVAYEDYYSYFKVINEAIDEINNELNPVLPLLIGGNSNHYPKGLDRFLSDFALDTNPAKNLDFISIHEYGDGDHPVKFQEIESEITTKLNGFQICSNIPIFVTELGFQGLPTTNEEDNLKQAAFMTSAIYYSRHAKQMRLFPWVLFHTPKQLSHVQFDTKLRMTPFGVAIKMLAMHENKEVFSTSDGLNNNGTGLGVLATKGDSSLVIELWNYQEKSSSGRVLIKNLSNIFTSSKLRVRKYLADSQYSNIFSTPQTEDKLEIVDEIRYPYSNEIFINVDLEAMALCLLIIEGIC